MNATELHGKSLAITRILPLLPAGAVNCFFDLSFRILVFERERVLSSNAVHLIIKKEQTRRIRQKRRASSLFFCCYRRGCVRFALL